MALRMVKPGTRTLVAGTSPDSNRNPNNWIPEDDPWRGANWARISPSAGQWLIEIFNPHEFAADLYVEGSKATTATKGSSFYLATFSDKTRSDVYVQIPGDNHGKPIALRFTPI